MIYPVESPPGCLNSVKASLPLLTLLPLFLLFVLENILRHLENMADPGTLPSFANSSRNIGRLAAITDALGSISAKTNAIGRFAYAFGLSVTEWIDLYRRCKRAATQITQKAPSQKIAVMANFFEVGRCRLRMTKTGITRIIASKPKDMAATAMA